MQPSKLKYSCTTRSMIAALIVAGGLTGCESMDRAEAVRLMNDGLDALERGSTSDAVRLLKEAQTRDTTYAEPAYFLGQVYHVRLNELDNAERYYREASDRDPENPQIAYRLGTVRAERGDHSSAVASFSTAVAKDPEFAKAWFRLGLSQEAQGNYADAVDAYNKSIRADARMRMDEKDPGGAAYHALGDVYIRFGFNDKALQVYENGILNNNVESRTAKPAQLYQGKGVALLKAHKFPEAAAEFKRALELDSTMSTAVFNLAVANMAMNNTEEAVAGFQQFNARADRATDGARIVAADGFIQQIKQKAAEQAE